MAKKILCVLRTSTMQQEIDSQKADMLGYLLSQGYKNDEIEWLISKGASARKASKAYLQMLEQIKSIIISSTTIKCCAVWHLNRLGRIGKYLDEMKNWFIDNHIQLLCKNPEITLLNADGSYNMANNIVFSVFASTIPAETEETMGKLKRGRDYLRQQGLWTGEPLKFGFTHDSSRHIVENLEEMKIVKIIYDEYATGKYSMHSLYLELASRGIEVSEWLIQKILTNNIYNVYVGDELWEKCKLVREGKYSMTTKEYKNCYLALKVLKCANCGSNYVTNSGHYVCYRKKLAYRFPENERCTHSPYVSTEVVDMLLWDIASSLHREYLMKMNNEGIEELSKKRDLLILKIKTLHAELDKIHQRMNRTKELYIEGDITKATYESRKEDFNRDINRIEDGSKQFSKEIGEIEQAIERLKNPNFKEQVKLMAAVGDITKEDEMREIVRNHIKEATIEDTEYDSKKCFLIVVRDYKGNEWKFIYDYTKKKCDVFSKLKRITKNGIVAYSYSHKPLNQVFQKYLDGAVEIIDSGRFEEVVKNQVE